MHQRAIPDKDTETFRSFSHVPKDPDIASETIERCREALKAYDPYLNVWWSPARGLSKPAPVGRWRIVQWVPRTGNWDTVTYWEGEDGAYRQPSPSEMLAEVQRLDLWARGDDASQLSMRLDAANARRANKAKETKHEDTFKDSIDFAEIAVGKRKSFDMKARNN